MEIRRILITSFIFIAGIAIGLTIQTVNATDIYCDREVWIFLFNNSMEGLQDCINSPDINQDIKLYQFETRLNVTESKVLEIERTRK